MKDTNTDALTEFVILVQVAYNQPINHLAPVLHTE